MTNPTHETPSGLHSPDDAIDQRIANTCEDIDALSIRVDQFEKRLSDIADGISLDDEPAPTERDGMEAPTATAYAMLEYERDQLREGYNRAVSQRDEARHKAQVARDVAFREAGDNSQLVGNLCAERDKARDERDEAQRDSNEATEQIVALTAKPDMASGNLLSQKQEEDLFGRVRAAEIGRIQAQTERDNAICQRNETKTNASWTLVATPPDHDRTVLLTCEIKAFKVRAVLLAACHEDGSWTCYDGVDLPYSAVPIAWAEMPEPFTDEASQAQQARNKPMSQDKARRPPADAIEQIVALTDERNELHIDLGLIVADRDKARAECSIAKNERDAARDDRSRGLVVVGKLRGQLQAAVDERDEARRGLDAATNEISETVSMLISERDTLQFALEASKMLIDKRAKERDEAVRQSEEAIHHCDEARNVLAGVMRERDAARGENA